MRFILSKSEFLYANNKDWPVFAFVICIFGIIITKLTAGKQNF